MYFFPVTGEKNCGIPIGTYYAPLLADSFNFAMKEILWLLFLLTNKLKYVKILT